MKKLVIYTILLLSVGVVWGQTNSNHVIVRGHTKSDGTHVPTHMRTAPNNTNRDNFSTKPNNNPYTGQPGWVTPDNKSVSNNNTPVYGSPGTSVSNTHEQTDNFPSFSELANNSLRNYYDSFPTYQTKSNSNIRQHMSTSSAIIETLPKGTSVKVLNSFFSDWWEVHYNGQRGYIHSSLLTFLSPGRKTGN